MPSAPQKPAQNRPAQTFSVKRAEVEFHAFASLGEPDQALRKYSNENEKRGQIFRRHADFIGPVGPFLEIGANVGHTSYLLANDFGADGFALDISADSLRYGISLMDTWGLTRAPVRIAGDAVRLPFKDNSLRLVLACQMLSQFMDIESVFIEVKRVLAPGGIFVFCEEPLRRRLSLRLYRAPYYNQMNRWERRLHDWGLLSFLTKDVIGAHQEESFGIRQNHRMNIADWHTLITRHFEANEYEILVHNRGWAESTIRKLAIMTDSNRSEWQAAKLLGGTLAAICRKAGEPTTDFPPIERFEAYLRCPDCGSELHRDHADTLTCLCGYRAPNEGQVFNLLPSEERAELYPGDREDVIDFCLPGHESRLIDGFYDLEGVYGGKYRWIGKRARARLKTVHPGPQRIRIRGHAHERAFSKGQPVKIEVAANGFSVGTMICDRPGLFVFEADLPDSAEYEIEVKASPEWNAPPDARVFTVHLSMFRLIGREE